MWKCSTDIKPSKIIQLVGVPWSIPIGLNIKIKKEFSHNPTKIKILIGIYEQNTIFMWKNYIIHILNSVSVNSNLVGLQSTSSFCLSPVVLIDFVKRLISALYSYNILNIIGNIRYSCGSFTHGRQFFPYLCNWHQIFSGKRNLISWLFGGLWCTSDVTRNWFLVEWGAPFVVVTCGGLIWIGWSGTVLPSEWWMGGCCWTVLSSHWLGVGLCGWKSWGIAYVWSKTRRDTIIQFQWWISVKVMFL